MCGVAGYLLRTPTGDPQVLASLLAGVRERGPDDEGAALVQRSTGLVIPRSTKGSRAAIRGQIAPLVAPVAPHDVALAHARYAIIDPSDDAHQPFVGGRGDVVAVLNGEIYNYVELRRDLAAAGITCRTSSDTEVLVEGFRLWGDALWPRLNGFWAVVLFDARDGAVTVARDRMGVAPLYYRQCPSGLYFASRIGPLLDVPPVTRARDDVAVRGFVLAGIKDFGPDTCFQEVKSFAPACVLRFGPGVTDIATASVQAFWRLPTTRWHRGELSLDEAAGGLRERLVRAVELRLRADVPVAFELSGGLDSSSIAAAASVLGCHVTTYTVTVPERDELPYARAVAGHLGVASRPLSAADDEIVSALSSFARVMEEPYHSPNLFTSYAMRRRIKGDGFAVVVSGAGGDEMLGGYEYEFWDAARAALWRDGEHWHVLRHMLGHHAGSWHRVRTSARDGIGLVKERLSGGRGARTAALETTPAERLRASYAARTFDQRVRFHFEVAQLPYYLRNGDHLTMAIPLEHRFPFLDVDVVEFGLRLPVRYLYRGGWAKYALRHAMRDLLPPSVVWRREKMGFPFPITRFLAHNAGILKPHVERAAARVLGCALDRGNLPSYRELVTNDPLLLWRLCSTGLWLDATG